MRRISEDSGRNALFSRYKRAAKKRNINFELTKEKFFYLTKQNCFYCGDEPKQTVGKCVGTGVYIYNGIDRKDNNLGYEINNCVACCWQCNLAKNKLSLEEWYTWIERIGIYIVTIQAKQHI